MNAELPNPVKRQLEQVEDVTDVTSVDEPKPEGEGEPEPKAEPEKVTANESVAKTPEGDAAYWKQRFDTVQGMLGAEAAKNKELVQTVSSLMRQIEELKKSVEKPEPKPQPLVTDKDVEAFGADLIDVVTRVAKQTLMGLEKRVEAMEVALRKAYQTSEQVAQRQVLSEQDRFVQTLTSLVPDWEKINADPRWLKWLAEEDPMVGAARQAALDEAAKAFDARRVAAIFNAWKAQFQPEVKTDRPVQELQKQVAPTKTGAGNVSTAAGKIWTWKEYEQAFDPRLNRTHTPEQIARLQKEAEQAYLEGRIR